jgi:two-component system cell cycle sensor histidine kinase/response regulator CckA
VDAKLHGMTCLCRPRTASRRQAGEGVLTISTDVVDSAGPHLRLTVTDTGTGMTPDLRARIFEPDFTTKKGSTGLGLSAVSLTVSQLRGSVAVESELNRGTSVAVLLPLTRLH